MLFFMAGCTASSSATLASQRAAEISGNDESSGMLNRKMLFPESVNQEPPLACVFPVKALRTVQRSALCRSRRELSNEYLLADFGVDIAENEPCKVRKFELSRI